jgi:hypothetical protein
MKAYQLTGLSRRNRRRAMAKLSPMARLALETFEKAAASGEETLTLDQLTDRINAELGAVARAVTGSLQ